MLFTGFYFYALSYDHSRPQSLRSFWPAAGIESSGSNHYERTKEITEFWLSGSLRICIYGACLKWLLPELSIPAAGQKDRRLWGREWAMIRMILDRWSWSRSPKITYLFIKPPSLLFVCLFVYFLLFIHFRKTKPPHVSKEPSSLVF